MKTGMNLMQLAQSLTQQKAESKDFVVPTAKLSMVVEKVGGQDVPALEFVNGQRHVFQPTNWAHSQLSSYTDIPKAYYDRIASENPVLLAENVNHSLSKLAGPKEARMVRTTKGSVRAILSSRFRRLDNFDLAENVLPLMMDKGMEVVSSELTERRLFIKALSPKLTTEITKGDVVQYGLVISNSDVGSGSVRVEPLIYRLVCLNGMISNTAIKRFHVGRNQAEEDIAELFSDSTKDLTDAAFWSQVQDVIKGSMTQDVFETQVDRLRIAANVKILNFDLPRVVELAAKATGITAENQKQSILAALASGNEGAGLTQWGLINSFTRAAQDDGIDYEASIGLERAAGQILNLAPHQWSAIAATG